MEAKSTHQLVPEKDLINCKLVLFAFPTSVLCSTFKKECPFVLRLRASPDGSHENVNVLRIRKYFTDDGWDSLMEVLQVKRSSFRYFCKVCRHELEDCTVIACDSCLEWSHLPCVGLKAAPKCKEWFCRQCNISV
jgi:hypothetical protein